MNAEVGNSPGEQAYAKAMRYELDYGCCPQCVLATVQEMAGGIDDATIKAVHGLSGGGALMAGGHVRCADRRAGRTVGEVWPRP